MHEAPISGSGTPACGTGFTLLTPPLDIILYSLSTPKSTYTQRSMNKTRLDKREPCTIAVFLPGWFFLVSKQSCQKWVHKETTGMGAASPTAFLHDLHTVETRTQAAVLLSQAQNRPWVHPVVSARLLSVQFYKLYEDLWKNFRLLQNEYWKVWINCQCLFVHELLRKYSPTSVCATTRERLAVTLK